MAEIVAFPTDTTPSGATALSDTYHDASNDRFLLDEGLELLADFRLIQDDQVRISLRMLVKSMAAASRTEAMAKG